MSNVAKSKYNQPNNIPRAQHHSLNRTPAENHSAHRQGLTYSSAARQGIPQPPHQAHDSVIGKSHSSANAVQQVVIQPQNLAQQVSNVNTAGPAMPTSAVPNSATNLQVLQQNQVMSQSANRFSQPFNQHLRPQQQRPLLTTHRTQNTVPTNAGVPQGVQQSVNMSGAQHQHYFIQHIPTNIQQIQNPMLNQQMSHSYAHQTRNIPNLQAQYYIQYPQQQQSYAPQQTYPYMYPTAHFQTQAHPNAQLIAPQMHQPRGAQVSAPPVIQAPQPMAVQMSAPNNIDVSEQQSQQKPVIQKRQRHCAVITDPSSGKNLNIEELAKETVKNQTPVTRSNESHTGASSVSNTSSASLLKLSPNDVDIALQFATKVAVAATEPIASHTSNATLNEKVVCVNLNSNSKLENDESVANSEPNLSELSETNETISDICEHSAEDNSLVINSNINSTISASNSNFVIENDLKLLNNTSAQNCLEIKSQNSVENNSSANDVNESLDNTDSCIKSMEEKEEMIPEIAKDHSLQRVININNNNNERKKESIKKVDKRLEELEVNKVDNQLDVTDNIVSVVDKIEPQPTTEPSSPVMLSSLSNENVDKSIKNEIIFNNICENDLEIKNQENNRINEINSNSNEVSIEDNEIETESAVESTKTTTLPDLPYKEDQWTPLNPEGKKHYDRNFLLAVREKSETAQKMPESLIEIRNQEIIRKSHPEPTGSGHVGDDPFLPGYASKSGNFHNRLMPPVLRRQSQPGRHQTDKQRKIISTSLTHEVKLHTTENAWKPTKIAATASDPEELETLELLKKIRGILNKLTPQKYDDLLKQILSFKIDTKDRLKRVLDLVFEKAVDEPAFCLQYANLCKHLSNFKVTVSRDDNNVEEVKFQKLLLSKCQKEFEADIYASITDLKERKEEIDKTTDPQKKKLLTEVLDEDMRRARKRSLGNIKLIGELYKLNMLRANIMVQCIDGLIRNSDDESLECLCALFKTIGEQIETEAANAKNVKQNYTSILDNFFHKMDNIADQKDPEVKGTSARVRFMLRDVIDMRKNNWRARRDENLPKMIDEIHQEAQKEVEQSARDLHQHTINRKQEERERKQKGGRQANDPVDQQWTTVSGRKSQTNAAPANIDWQKMRLNLAQNQNHDNVQLGPQSGSWSAGSRGGAQTSQSRFQPMDDKQVNRFSPLDANDNRKSSQKQTIPSRDSSKGRSNQQHSYQQSGRGGRSQGGGRGGEREDAINLARNFSSQRQSPSESSQMYPNMISRNSSRSGSRETSAPNSRNSSMRRETPDIEVSQLKGSNISEEELEQKCLVSIKEYLNVGSVNEPVLDVIKLCNDSTVHVYITTAINSALDISSQSDHFNIGKLINHLISTKIIQIQHFYKGLSSILDCAVDMELDVPKMWDYIGEVLAPIFVNLNTNRKQFLIEVSKLCELNKSSKLIAKILWAVSKFTNEIKANELWISSDLNWRNFLQPDEDIDKFVEQNNVEFTTKIPNKSLNLDQIQTFVNEVEALVRQKKSNDEIQSFISKYFNASQTSDHRFTSALFKAVISGCIIAPPDSRDTSFSYTLDSQNLISIAPLLGKFLGGDPERELQALIVLQELMDKLQHPPNVLQKIFYDLYESSVISHDAFLQWEKSENSGIGKAVAVKSVVRFLTWLRENEDDEEESEVNAS